MNCSYCNCIRFLFSGKETKGAESAPSFPFDKPWSKTCLMSFNSNIDFSNSSNIYGNSLSLLLQAFAREGQKAKQCSIFFYDEVSAKGSFQKHFSGFCPLRGGGTMG